MEYVHTLLRYSSSEYEKSCGMLKEKLENLGTNEINSVKNHYSFFFFFNMCIIVFVHSRKKKMTDTSY